MSVKRETSSRRRAELAPPQAAIAELAYHRRHAEPMMSSRAGDSVYRQVVRFLAGEDEGTRRDAFRLWAKFAGMIGSALEYEEEASAFIACVMDVIGELDPETNPAMGLDRSELRERDIAVAEAARAFVEAIDNHPSYIFRWSGWCRPAGYTSTKVLDQRVGETLSETMARELASLVRDSPPTPRMVALRVEKRARELAGLRMQSRKLRQKTEKRSVLTRRGFERGIIDYLVQRYPSAKADRLAEITAPIMEHAFNSPGSFSRCRDLARCAIRAARSAGG